MSGTAREQLGAVLGVMLGADVAIVTDPRQLVLQPGKRYTVQILRAAFRPHPDEPENSYSEQMHLWVVSHKESYPDAEDDLDVAVLEVTAALEKLNRTDPWSVADRVNHPQGFPAYRVAVPVTTDKVKE